ncbi:MAG: four helix bundle protein [Bacteroidaceae bacterium]|nr:four helix bundle protein [Bacteroidaceae bacterium]
MAVISVLGEKSMAFGKRVAKCYAYLIKDNKERSLPNQLLRSGTSIGANVREGISAQSKKDFISKMGIALKEAKETDYWLEIMYVASYFDHRAFLSLKADNDELIAMLTSTIKTAKQNI